jgi:hypothetical protein
MQVWQPIETAPRNGWPILGYIPPAPSGEFGQNVYVGTLDFRYIPEWGVVICFWYDAGPGMACWSEASADRGFDGGHTVEPTHWMPLPKPPAEG